MVDATRTRKTPDHCLLVGQNGRLPFQTAHPKLFAGGGAVRGADLVVTAVHDGREAAASIGKWLLERMR